VTRTTTPRLIAEQLPNLYSRKTTRLALEPNLDPERSLCSSLFLFEEINALKRQLNPEKTASSKKRKAESILSTEIDLTTISDEGEESLFTFLNQLLLKKLC
jgi:hypothetical protein